ncbi:MAG: DoxX family protein [Acidimicrobiia bacterium]|nr:DoxX family protein [Acidimicrobiia bacterium]
MGSNRTLWVLQIVFGVYFLAIGITHFVVPDGLPNLMSWMYELSDGLHAVSGVAEILGGLGLILPGLTKIQPNLTVLAAFGLAAVMIGAAIWHASRGEGTNIANNVVLGAIVGYIGYARWKVTPLEGQTAA